MKNRQHRSRRHTQSGQSVIIFALSMLVLVGMMALSIDGGFVLAERRQVQSAAAAAALAAAKAALDNHSAAVVEETGITFATLNAGDGSTATINPTTYSGLYGEVNAIEAIVTKPVRQFFAGAIYDGAWTVTARAVAAVEPIERTYALLALRDCSNGGLGIHINGQGTVNVHEGSIMSNCNITRAGQSSVVTSGGTIDAAGYVDPGNLWTAEGGIWGNRPTVNDPVVAAGIVPPSRTAAQAVRTVTTSAQLQSAVTNLNASGRCPNGATCVMQPGYYGGNLTLQVQGTLLMQTGIYYFGDSFSLTTISDGATIIGTNMLLYITDSAAFAPANAQVTLSANPTSLYTGGLDGMVFWIANCTPYLMQANGSFTLNGVIYAPCSTVRLYGAPGSYGMQAIVGNLELSGGGTFSILFREYIQSASPRVYLVE